MEKDSAAGGGFAPLIALTVAISALVHVGVMMSVKDMAFAPLPDQAPKGERHWTKELPIMQVRKLDRDPLQLLPEAKARPVAPPEVEKQEDRVDRLAAATAKSALPDLPESAAGLPVGVAVEPAKVEAMEWTPRQEIVAIENPTVPDEAAALQRIVIPEVPRVRNAPDITPSQELIGKAGSLGAAAVTAPPEGVAAAGVDKAGGGAGSGGAGGGPVPPKVTLPAAALGSAAVMEDKAPSLNELANKAAEKADEKKKPQQAAAHEPEAAPPPPVQTQVDVAAVAKKKEAVRKLRDEAVSIGKPIANNVRSEIGWWTDPQRRNFKYFRIRISSRGENPLPIVSKDVVFMLDASGSISNERLRACRKQVKEALRRLNSGDRFNVVAFRDKFQYAFTDTAWKEVTAQTLDRADEWLDRLTAHGQTDVFRTLQSVLNMPRDSRRPIVALVVTDGEATSGMTRSAEIVSRFSELNGGLISIYMYGVRKEANAYLMDMLSRMNRGGWARYSGLFRGSSAKGIPELAAQFERPVLSDISVMFTATSKSDTYPKLVRNLGEGAPIEIYGICPADQKEVTFRVRGLNGGETYENMFTMKFEGAERLDEGIRTEWAKHRILELISAYTMNPKESILRDMKMFAQSYGVEIPYEKEIK